MRDEANRPTYVDLVRRQYEKMDPVDPMTNIPDDELKNTEAVTSQSISDENSDRIDFSPENSGTADSEQAGALDPDRSAVEAWRATGAEPDNRRLGEETEQNYLQPDPAPSSNTAYTLGQDANATYPLGYPQENPAFRDDPRITGTTAGMSDADSQTYEASAADDAEEAELVDAPLEDVPDADEIQAGSPVDPATPPGQDQHGIDLLNGVGGLDDETGRKLP